MALADFNPPIHKICHSPAIDLLYHYDIRSDTGGGREFRSSTAPDPLWNEGSIAVEVSG